MSSVRDFCVDDCKGGGSLPVEAEKEILELKGAIQTYAWGKVGNRSKVAQLYEKNDPNFVIEETSPYAELWMGTHCNGPSSFKSTGQMLKEWLLKNFKTLGWPLVKTFGTDLPFLFKVLSVEKALSIQAHPSKSHAEQLHKLHPDIYKDPNHKPEMAIALTEFEALCAFRPICEIKLFMRETPQLQEVIGLNHVETFLRSTEASDTKLLLKTCFAQLMRCPKEKIEQNLASLLEAIKEGKKVYFAGLFQRLYDQYPGDVGCFCIYFLHHVVLDPGESIFLGPNIPHAYISGDCVECMACSDNVVRAGLTPKFRDVETLCEMLTYESVAQEDVKFKPVIEDDNTKIYRTPFPDFAVANIVVEGDSTYSTLPRNTASIILVVEGKGETRSTSLQPGTIIYLHAEKILEIHCKEMLTIFQAFANL